jgi:hypothetical protein
LGLTHWNAEKILSLVDSVGVGFAADCGKGVFDFGLRFYFGFDTLEC